MPLPESQHTLISEHPLHPTSSKNEDGRVLGPAPHKSLKNTSKGRFSKKGILVLFIFFFLFTFTYFSRAPLRTSQTAVY